MNQLILQLKKEVNNSTNGHLNLARRVELASLINDKALINKVYLECAKLVYRKYNISDNLVHNLLYKAEQFLYANIENDFIQLFNQNKNNLESISNQPNAGVSVTVLSLLGSIAFNAEEILNIEDYEGEDDDSYDWENWNPDFYAANSYANGNPFTGLGEISLRREFWFWFLEMNYKIIQKPYTLQSLPLKEEIDLSKDNIDIIRNKKLNTFVKKNLIDTINLILKDVEGQNWDKIIIEGVNIGSISMKGFLYQKKEKKRIDLTYYLYKGDQSSVKLMGKIKKEMYDQSKHEGT